MHETYYDDEGNLHIIEDPNEKRMHPLLVLWLAGIFLYSFLMCVPLVFLFLLA